MRAGKLRRRVSIEAPATGRGPNGEEIGGWTPVCQAWMEFADVAAGGDRVAADMRTAVQQRVATIRRRAGITPKMRVLDGANAYEIVDVADADRRDKIVLTLKSIEAQVRS